MNAPTDSTYLIVGAAGGIGSALARRLASGGNNLVLAGRASEGLTALGAELGASVVEADARSRADLAAAVDAAKSTDSFAGAVNCAGSILLKPAHRTTEAEFADVVATNLTTAFELVASAAPALRGGGSIVLFSSAAATTGMPNHEAIAAAKAGVEGLARAAAASYARSGVRVNAVAPGLVDTPLSASIAGNEAALQASTAMHALGRIGTADDIAGLAAWLLGPESSWVTGQVYGCDGGLARVRPPARLGA